MKRLNLPTAMVASLLPAGAAYHLALVFLDVSVAGARSLGLLISEAPAGGLWPAFGLGDLASVDWSGVLAVLPNLVPVVLVTLLCLLVYINGLQLATGVEIDMDRELR